LHRANKVKKLIKLRRTNEEIKKGISREKAFEYRKLNGQKVELDLSTENRYIRRTKKELK